MLMCLDDAQRQTGGKVDIEDNDWKASFGTTDSQIEKPEKPKKAKVAKHQFEAGLILTQPELFGLLKPEPPETAQDRVH